MVAVAMEAVERAVAVMERRACGGDGGGGDGGEATAVAERVEGRAEG